MKQFLKTLFLFFLPIIILLCVLIPFYILSDPFRIIRPYDDYSYMPVITSRDYISTEMYLKNKDKYNYNSFIFGSSRTIAFRPESWKKYLKQSDQPFVFDASSENINGIYQKIAFINNQKAKINNALIIIDHDATFTRDDDSPGHLTVKHRAISGSSLFSFHFIFFRVFTTPEFLYYFLKYKFTHHYDDSMFGYIENRKIKMDSVNNQITIEDHERELTYNPAGYYGKRKAVFYQRKGEVVDSKNKITNSHVKTMQEIVNIFKAQKTDYKIIIGPLYEQVKFSTHDLEKLEKVFGNHLYDFSGANEFTSSVSNYYEASHYRPLVGDAILKRIYNK